MPLVLSLREGQDFYIADTRFMIRRVHSETHFELRNHESGDVFDISEKRATEVLPDVFISAGDRPQMQIARVAIDAPPTILVLRGEKYRTPPEEVGRR